MSTPDRASTSCPRKSSGEPDVPRTVDEVTDLPDIPLKRARQDDVVPVTTTLDGASMPATPTAVLGTPSSATRTASPATPQRQLTQDGLAPAGRGLYVKQVLKEAERHGRPWFTRILVQLDGPSPFAKGTAPVVSVRDSEASRPVLEAAEVFLSATGDAECVKLGRIRSLVAAQSAAFKAERAAIAQRLRQ